MMDEVRLSVVPVHDAGLAGLIAKLDRELLESYPAEDIFGVDLEDAAETRDIVFAVAFAGNEPVGCGAIRPLDADSVELKRFYVDASFRQRGIASSLLRFLEQQARDGGYTILRLETGELLAQAVGLYKKFGFCEIERYGPYVNSPQSLCMEKKL